MSDLFRALGEGVTVHFRFAGVEDRPWASALRDGYQSRVFHRRFGIDWHFIKLVLGRQDTCFILCSWEDPTELASILLARLLRRHYVIWTDTPNLVAPRPWWKQHLRSMVLRFAFRGAYAVLGTGVPALQALRQMGCAAEKLVDFPYFIDVNAYRLRCPQRGPLRVLSCGRLIREKGFDLALRALAKWGGEFSYRIAGKGPEESSLRELADELGIGARVRFLGWLEPAALRNLYADSDLLLHPARFEPYGVCVLEAMASGMVVIGSTQTAAVIDRVVDGVNGVVHATGNIDAIAAGLQRADLAMGLAARATAEQWPLSRAAAILEETLRPRRSVSGARLG